MKQTNRYLLILFTGVVLMLALFGCGKQKYKLNFDGCGFESKKTAYAAGEKVIVRYRLIATDTDYRFWVDDDVELSREYDDDHGHTFTFAMPDHDVTIHVEQHNSMAVTEQASIRVTVINDVTTADVWIMPQTKENLKTSLWGTASVKNLGAGERRGIDIADSDAQGAFIVRIIDDDHAYYAAKDVQLDDGYSIRFKTEDSKYDAVIEILDTDGNVLRTQEVFQGVFGAK